jgi:hypothetical protein
MWRRASTIIGFLVGRPLNWASDALPGMNSGRKVKKWKET